MVLDRRSVRRFLPDPVPPAVVADVLRLAVWAPSPHNVQPWRFTVLSRPADRERLATAMAGRLAEVLKNDGVAADLIEQQTERSIVRINNAPVVILCSLVADGLVSYADGERRTLEWQMAVQSVGAVMQTIFLLAWTRDLGTCWMAAPMYCPDVVRDCLNLPSSYEPQALTLMGYPAAPGKVRPRRSPDAVVDMR
ncbi:MAG TPA: nitroreductase family protein [Chloroflexota bacterium]